MNNKNINFNPQNRSININGKILHLRRKEYELLEFMARNAGRVINRLSILEYVWNYSIHCNTNTLDVHIAALRRKLRTVKAQKIIRTIHGLGYKFQT